MKKTILLFCVAALFGCNSENDKPTAQSPTGGKDDSFGASIPSETCPDPSTLSRPEWDACRDEGGETVDSECCIVRCTNVWVNYDLNSGLFEEGFGSAFDFDPDGYGMTDGSSTETMVELVPMDSGDPQYEVSLGQRSYNSDEETVEQSVGRGGDSDYRAFNVTTEGCDEFEFRAFDEPRIGILMYKGEGEDRWQHYSTSDCRPGNSPPYF